MTDLRCPLCGHVLARNFEGTQVSLKCHRHPPGGKVICFEVVGDTLRTTLHPVYLTNDLLCVKT